MSTFYMEHKEKLFQSDSSVGIYLQYPVFNESIDDTIEKWVELLGQANCGIEDDNVFLYNLKDYNNLFFLN